MPKRAMALTGAQYAMQTQGILRTVGRQVTAQIFQQAKEPAPGAYKKAATKAPKPTMEPAAALRLTAAPAEFWGAPVPEAVDDGPEPEARPVPEADEPEPEPEPEAEAVAPALLEAAEPEVGAFRTMVVELLALTMRVRVELPSPATGMV